MTRQALRCGCVLSPTNWMSAAIEMSPETFFQTKCIASSLNHMFAPLAPTEYAPWAGSKAPVPGLLTVPMSPWSLKMPRSPSAFAEARVERSTLAQRILKGVEFIGGLGEHNTPPPP